MKKSLFTFCNAGPLRLAILAITLTVFLYACASAPPAEEAKPADVKQQTVQTPKSTAPSSSTSSRAQQSTTSSPATVSSVKADEAVAVYLVITTKTSLRAEPKSKAKVITRLKKGEKVIRLSSSGKWLNVELADQTTGWVLKKYTKEEKLN